MKIQDLKDQNHLLFECITGSRAYNLDLPTSDTDLKGVYVLPKEMYYGLDYIPQISNETNDEVYYELKRYLELLYKNNPNLLEMLSVPPQCILYKHPLFDLIQPQLFISKLCKDTFAGYATTQIRKARGLNKKIVNPVAKERKNVLDFCYVTDGQGSKLLLKWLAAKGLEQQYCGLVNIPNMPNTYGLFYDHEGAASRGEAGLGFKGVMQKPAANEVSLSSIPKGMKPLTVLSFNKDGYKKYCKDYRQYWDWVEKRNETRYENTLSHGKNYDAKNMMHTFRLLDMAAEIAEMSTINVWRHNREELLAIRSGELEYDDLVAQAETKIERINTLFAACDLPKQPDKEQANRLLVEIRTRFYEAND